MEMVGHLPHADRALRGEPPDREQNAKLSAAKADSAGNGAAQ